MQGEALSGGVDNGHVVQVKIGRFYEGSAGLRARDGFSEVAYRGKAPTRFPQDVTIAGIETKATAARKSEVKGMTVVMVDWMPPGD